MPATNQSAVSTLIREVLADPDLAHDEVFRRLLQAGPHGPGRRRGRRRDRRAALWIAPGVVEGLNPWKDEDHARTREAPR